MSSRGSWPPVADAAREVLTVVEEADDDLLMVLLTSADSADIRRFAGSAIAPASDNTAHSIFRSEDDENICGIPAVESEL